MLEIKPTLATDGYKCKKLDKLLEQGLWVSPKLDGYRCIVEIKNGKCALWSRNGKQFTNFPKLVAHIEKHLGHLDILLDGEVMSDDFSAIQQSAFAIKRGTVVGDIEFHIFDMVDSITKQARNANLLYLIKETDYIKLVPQYSCFTEDSLKEYLKMSLANGYEGIMAVPDTPYKEGRRCNHLLKFKPELTMDCIILGFEEGTNRFENSLGSLVVKQENDKVCQIGTGLSDELRARIWRQQDAYRGKMVEAKYQELTKDGIMRFPSFKRFREDKE